MYVNTPCTCRLPSVESGPKPSDGTQAANTSSLPVELGNNVFNLMIPALNHASAGFLSKPSASSQRLDLQAAQLKYS